MKMKNIYEPEIVIFFIVYKSYKPIYIIERRRKKFHINSGMLCNNLLIKYLKNVYYYYLL